MVANSVFSMTPYDELATPAELRADCEAASRALGLSEERALPAPVAPDPRLERAARQAMRPAPSLHYDEFPHEVHKSDIRISEAAQRLANALHLHLD